MFMIDQSIGVLEVGEAGACSAWDLFCQFLLPDSFTAGPPFRWAAALAPPTVLGGGSASAVFSLERCGSSPCQGCRPSYAGLKVLADFLGHTSHHTCPSEPLEVPDVPKVDMRHGRSKHITFWSQPPAAPFCASIRYKTKYLICYDALCISVVDMLVDV